VGPTSRLASCAALFAAAAAAQGPPAVAIQGPVRSGALVERWAVEADSTHFLSPRSLAVTGDCAVWLADPATGLWRSACDTGVPVQIARIGSGAGEYELPWFVTVIAPDTVAVWDARLQVLNEYTAGGALAGSRAIRAPEASYGRAGGAARAPNGSLLLRTVKPYPPPSAEERIHLLAVTPNGDVRDSILSLDGAHYITYEAAFAFGRHDAPLQRRPFVVFFRDASFLVGRNDSARVDLYDQSGGRVRSIVLPLPGAHIVTRADRAAYADSIRASTEREMAQLQYDDALRARVRAEIETMLRGVRYPAMRQRYDRLLLDDRNQAMWVLLPGAGAEYDRTWMICSLTAFSFCSTASVQHRGAVIDAAVSGGALYTIERARDGRVRVVKYAG
jgi:hypothetical protein